MGFKSTITYFIAGAALTTALLKITGADNSMISKYHEIKQSLCADEGTAHIHVQDEDGLDSLVLSNNTAEDGNLTQIPQLELQNLYEDGLVVDFPDLRSGRYVFTARITDDEGNVQERDVMINIENGEKGVKSLYGVGGSIDNRRVANGKERFVLN